MLNTPSSLILYNANFFPEKNGEGCLLLSAVKVLKNIGRGLILSSWLKFGGVVAQWCNTLTLKPEWSGGVGSNPGRTAWH